MENTNSEWKPTKKSCTFDQPIMLILRPCNIDAKKIGGMGVSWGGVITSRVIGFDARFAFGIPSYGCGHLFDAENYFGRELHDNEDYKQVWDGMNYADRVKMPVLWLSWPQDPHFPICSQAEHYRKAPGPRMVSLITKMGHNHVNGWTPPDGYAFAKSVVETGKPWGSLPLLDILSHFWRERIPVLGMESLVRNTPSIIAGTQ
jgi:cephalosporin-C deacetylase-like acetyl esterase